MDQMSRISVRRSLLLGLLALGIVIGAPTRAHAQVELFVNPMIGYNFGGDAGCPRLNECKDKRLNVSVSAGAIGNKYGLEEEMAYAADFFGHAPNISSSVFTLMVNGVLIPKVGPVRPYALAGLGLIRTHVRLTA